MDRLNICYARVRFDGGKVDAHSWRKLAKMRERAASRVLGNADSPSYFLRQ
jgi:sulfite reductase beta subunit-like hemoprotein